MGGHIITLSRVTLNISHLVLLSFFILMKTLAIAAPHLFCNQNTRTKVPCRGRGPPQYLMKKELSLKSAQIILEWLTIYSE